MRQKKKFSPINLFYCTIFSAFYLSIMMSILFLYLGLNAVVIDYMGLNKAGLIFTLLSATTGWAIAICIMDKAGNNLEKLFKIDIDKLCGLK